MARVEDDDRGRQAKALQRWEAQKAEWDRLQRRLAKRVGKVDVSTTLHGSIHTFRMRSEELGMIDASVPAEVKNGVSAWEMNLRASSGGVRYVQVGSSYPYPLYCPIRDAESVKPDNNILMKVIPPVVPPRDKPVSEGEYFKSKQHEFQKHIKRKFSHYNASTFFGIEGTAPPLAAAPIPEDPSTAAVQFVPPPPVQHSVDQNSKLSLTSPSAALSVKDEPHATAPSRPLSANIGKAGIPFGTGPMIVLSTAHLHFSATPNETVQATLRIENTGTTAVFYSWTTCEGDAALPLSPTNGTKPSMTQSSSDGLFRLSDVANAVLLPDETKYFTVSFRSPNPGIFTHLLELLTVPAGRERIVIHLRAVVVGGDGDVVNSIGLESSLDAAAPREFATAVVNDIVLRESNNAFDAAAIQRKITERQREISTRHMTEEAAAQLRRTSWLQLNAPLKLNYNVHVFDTLARLHEHVLAFVRSQQPPITTATAWTGSVRDLLEDIGLIRDTETRASVLDTAYNLIAAAAAAGDEDEGTSLNELVWRAASRRAWGAAADRIHQASSAAREIAENRMLVKGGVNVTTGKDKGAAKAAAPAPKKGGAPVVAPVAEVSDKPNTPEFDAVFFALSRRCVSDAIDNMIDSREQANRALRHTCSFGFDVVLGSKLESALTAADKEMEQLVDPAAAKGKKK